MPAQGVDTNALVSNYSPGTKTAEQAVHDVSELHDVEVWYKWRAPTHVICMICVSHSTCVMLEASQGVLQFVLVLSEINGASNY